MAKSQFYTTCIKLKKSPKLWRKAKVIAILKPGKPADDPASYSPISLLCIGLKLFERIILNRIEDIVEGFLFPEEQGGFWKGESTVDQVALLIEEIEAAFEENKKAGLLLIDLTAAYDMVWQRGLTRKLLQCIPSKGMV